MTNSRIFLIAFATFIAGLLLGMFLQPAKFRFAVKSLQEENRLLREMYDLRTEELKKITEVLNEK